MLEQDFEQSVGYWAHMLSRAFERALNEELKPLGITLRQCQVLGWLALEAELTQAHLAERMHIEPPTLVRILDRMERVGWIERHPDVDDRRKKLIRATRRVRPLWERIMTCIHSVRARATAGIEAHELDMTRNVLGRMQQNLQAEQAAAARP